MIVADTTIVLRGVRSPQGASGFILAGMLKGEIAFAASPAVVLEYEDVLKRADMLGKTTMASHEDIDVILDVLCFRAVATSPWFRFRPFLDDPKDDLFVECALTAGARLIVTDDRHFRHPSLRAFGLRVISAGNFVSELLQERRRR
jgi:predicted nucleic acid-binding protein